MILFVHNNNNAEKLRDHKLMNTLWIKGVKVDLALEFSRCLLVSMLALLHTTVE